MIYNNGTMMLAKAVDTARREESARRRALPRRTSMRVALGTGLVRLGERVLPRGLEIPTARARSSP